MLVSVHLCCYKLTHGPHYDNGKAGSLVGIREYALSVKFRDLWFHVIGHRHRCEYCLHLSDIPTLEKFNTDSSVLLLSLIALLCIH